MFKYRINSAEWITSLSLPLFLSPFLFPSFVLSLSKESSARTCYDGDCSVLVLNDGLQLTPSTCNKIYANSETDAKYLIALN